MSEWMGAPGHPDADLLSAFAEGALLPAEREQALLHLAVCARCRQVVALSAVPAQPPAARAEAPAPVWSRAPSPAWSRAWGGVAALAMAVLLVAFLLLRPHPVPPAPAASEQAEMHAPAPPAVPERQAAPSSPAPASRNENKARAGQRQAAPLPKPSPPPRAEGGSVNGALAGAAASTGFAVSNGRAAPAPVALAPPAATLAQDASVDTANSTVETMNVATLRLPPVAALPSSLTIRSTAAHGQDVLAVDAAGALFYSQDGGQHWQAVQASWPGRVLRVENNTSGSSQSVVLGSVLAAPQAARAVAPAPMAPSSAAASAPALPASITGQVTDASGAVIPGASIAVLDREGTMLRSTRSDFNGRYVVEGLAPGTYRIRAEQAGFARLETPVEFAGGAHAAQADLRLPLASSTQTVTVSGGPVQMQNAPVRKRAVVASGFALTTEAGERWTSVDGLHWLKAAQK